MAGSLSGGEGSGSQTGQRRDRLCLKQLQAGGQDIREEGIGAGIARKQGIPVYQQAQPAHLAGGVVEHLLPRRVQPVLVSHDALLGHKHHLPGSVVHAHGPLIPQGCLLCLLLGLGGRGPSQWGTLRDPS